MILIFFGPPGAGKGTQARFISDKLNIIHLSTGDILRNQLEKTDKLSLQLKNIMDSGQLVSDDILNQTVSKRFQEEDCKNGFVLDGYPRTMEQAFFLNDYLNKINMQINYIFDFYAKFDVLKKRIINRSIIEKRSDDSENIIKTRILKYTQITKPVSDFYKKKYDFAYNSINADQEITKLNSELLKIVKK